MTHRWAQGLMGGVVLGFGVWVAGGTAAGDPPPPKDVPPRFRQLPRGWAVKESGAFPGRKLGAVTVQLTNTVLTCDGQEIKVNLAECQTDEDAAKVHDLLLRAHANNHAQCPREGKVVAEFVGNDLRLFERAYQDLGFKPPKVTYEVTFQAAPVEKGDYRQWNQLFNAFLVPQPDEARIRELARGFTFGDRIRLRTCGLGREPTAFTFSPPPRERLVEADGEITSLAFADLPRKHGLPDLGVALTVTAEAFALTPSRRKAGMELLEPTEFWPSADAEIVALARQITAGKATVRDKTAALLDWLRSGKHLKYGGPEMGTRYGVKHVLQQGFGRCWDFSDGFVTLCRAAGVPSRQVLGWLHGQSGHVWAEVLLEGEGWRQVDPTAGMGCDCRYLPFVATEDGRMPLVYLSAVDIRIKR